jgi:ComF family protein
MDECHSVLRYEDSIREWLLSFKFFQQTKLCKLLGTLFHRGLMIQEVELTGQLVPAPLSNSRLRQRQFNQAQLLALEIQRHISTLSLPKTNPINRKIQGSSQATTLNIEQRSKNVQNVFEVHLTHTPDHVWLVDDVMTSGATLNEIARVLKKSGVTFVGSLTLARRLLDS